MEQTTKKIRLADNLPTRLSLEEYRAAEVGLQALTDWDPTGLRLGEHVGRWGSLKTDPAGDAVGVYAEVLWHELREGQFYVRVLIHNEGADLDFEVRTIFRPTEVEWLVIDRLL